MAVGVILQQRVCHALEIPVYFRLLGSVLLLQGPVVSGL